MTGLIHWTAVRFGGSMYQLWTWKQMLTTNYLQQLQALQIEKLLVLHHPRHKQSVEQHIKLVAEESAQVAGFDTRHGVIRQKNKSRKLMKTFATKKQFK